MTGPYLVTTAVGAEALLAGDLQQAGARATVRADGELTVEHPELTALLRRVALADRVAVPHDGADAGLQQAETVCRAAGFVGELAFRVGCADPVRRAAAIADLVQRTGWRNDPSHWQLNVDLDRSRIEIGPLAWAARFGRMRRLPATTPPVVAAAVLRWAKIGAEDRLLDPCCGTGTMPLVDALVRRAGSRQGVDIDAEAIDRARANAVALEVPDTDFRVADATHLPVRDGSIDRVVADLPFGKRIGSHDINRTLYPAVLADLDRVVVPDGRAVLITDDKRLFEDQVQRAKGWKVVKENPLRYNGVSPTAYVLARTTPRRRTARPQRHLGR